MRVVRVSRNDGKVVTVKHSLADTGSPVCVCMCVGGAQCEG